MMKIPLLVFALALSTSCAFAQNITKVTTLVAQAYYVTNGFDVATANTTNTVLIPNGEAARVSVIKNGIDAIHSSAPIVYYVFAGSLWSAQVGDVIQGPAEVSIQGHLICCPSMITLERFKVVKSK